MRYGCDVVGLENHQESIIGDSGPRFELDWVGVSSMGNVDG